MTATGRNKDEVDISGSTICLEVHMIERARKAVRGPEDDHASVGLVVRTGAATLRRIRRLSAARDSPNHLEHGVKVPNNGTLPADSQTPYPLRERISDLAYVTVGIVFLYLLSIYYLFKERRRRKRKKV